MAAPRHRQGHIAQCLGRILACRGSATAAVAAGPGGRRLTGAEFVDGVRSLAAGLADRGVRPGHVVAAVALNRYLPAYLPRRMEFVSRRNDRALSHCCT